MTRRPSAVLKPTFYKKLEAGVVAFIAQSLPEVKAHVRRTNSPLRALCYEYDEQLMGQIRIESQADWIQRDLKEASYKVCTARKWNILKAVRLRERQVAWGIRNGRFGPATLCQRSFNRTFQLSRLFPEKFGIDRPAAHDWSWEYRVGEMHIAASETHDLFHLVQPYWIYTLENQPEIWNALEGEFTGKGETCAFVRPHIDAPFVDALKSALRKMEKPILAIPHTSDFVAFISLVESDFTPEMVAIGYRAELKHP